MAGTELLGEEVLAETLSKGGLMVKGGLKSVMLAGIFLLALGTTAMATDITYYSGDIWGGQTIDVGNIYAILHYDATDTTLVIKYETEGGWMIEKCDLWIGTTPPIERGAPGQYPYNSGPVNDDEYSFSIPISELRTKFGINWGSAVYVMPHCDVWLDENKNGEKDGGEQGQTGYGGTVIKPKKGSWFGYFCFRLDPPEEPNPGPEPYSGITLTRGYWKRFWWTPTPQKPRPPQWWTEESKSNFLPVTLAGVEFEIPYDFWSQLDLPVRAKIFNQFLDQLIALYCNMTRNGDLDGVVYQGSVTDYYGWTVAQIFAEANSCDEDTDRATLVALKTVMDEINNNETTQVLVVP